MDDANIKHIGWDDLDKRKFYIFGPSLMVGARLLIFPPILIKTRLQVQRKSSLYNGTFDAFRKIYRYEGVRGFYKGFGTNTFTILSGQIYVSVFEVSRASLSNVNETCKNLIAGLFASIVGQTITVPIDIISQKQMVTGQRLDVSSVISKRDYKSRSAWSVILEISKTSGLRGFYKGYVASLLTYAPGSSIWWASYYVFTQFLGDLRPSGMPDILIQGMSGSAASFVSSVCTNPADVVRTRLQVEDGKETILSVCRNLYYEEGVSGCYKGLTARLTSSMPSGFFIIATYELIKNLSKKEDQG